MRLKAGITAAAIVAMAAFSFSGTADAYPDKPVQLTVGFGLVDHPVSPHALCRNVSKR